LVASSFNWSDFLELAKQLQRAGSESSYRTAISRAYYAAFHPARAYVLTRHGQFLEKRSEHDQTWGRFARSNDAEESQLGQWGNDLKRLRVNADYHLNRATGSREVLTTLNYANKIIQQIEKFRSNAEPSAE